MSSKEIPIDTSDPMNGLVAYLKGNNQLSEYLSIEASSTFTDKYRVQVNTLFDRSTSVWFQNGNNKIGEYFEIHFLKGTYIWLTAYGFMSSNMNSWKPRNWNVSCMSTSTPTLLANEVNNRTLCNDVAEDSACNKNDNQVFYCKNLVKCSSIRFTGTGPVSGDDSGYLFALAGIELFGYFNTFPKIKKGLIQTIINNYHEFFSWLFTLGWLFYRSGKFIRQKVPILKKK